MSDDKKFQAFIEEHLPFIHQQIKVLKSGGDKAIPKDIPDEELFTHGVHGLVEAIHSYDPNKAKNTGIEGENTFLKHAKIKIHGRMRAAAQSQNDIAPSLKNRARNLKNMRQKAQANPKPETEE